MAINISNMVGSRPQPGRTYQSSSYTSGGAVPSAPVTKQLNAASDQFTGQTPAQGAFSFTGGPGYTKVKNPAYDPRSTGQNKNAFIYQYTGSPNGAAGGADPMAGAPTGAQAAIAQNPWSASAMQSAVDAGQQSGGQAGANFGQATNMRGGADMLQGGAGSVMETAFDPRNALYDRTLQRLQDQVRVGQASRGITMSPYGAGLENDALSNFNIDWENEQLQRQVSGLGAAGQATGQAGQANVTGANLGQQGVAQTQAVGQTPWDTYNQQQQTNIQNWIAYMNQQNAATNNAMQNYPNVLSEQSMRNAGGVPYIPQSMNTFSFGGF
jgi:hypothetical protein